MREETAEKAPESDVEVFGTSNESNLVDNE